MTGYGIARKQSETSLIEVSVKTVNGRFLESRIHLPREFSSIESEIRKLVGSHFGRGTVDVFVNRKSFGGAGTFEVNARLELAKEWIKSYKQLGKSLKITPKLDLMQIARLPEIMTMTEKKESLDQDGVQILSLTQEALKACNEERKREGLSLQKELLKLLAELKKQVSQMSELRVEANKLLEERYRSKLQTRLGDLSVDPQRLAQEVVFQLEKADIDEELTRLNEHTKNYEQLLSSAQAEGKKLDFYTQELLREVNTVGSKSQVAKLTNTVVVAKTIIEKLREQVQNIE